jgi:hypothetical protein
LSPPRTHHLRISSEQMNHARRSAASAFFNSLLVLLSQSVAAFAEKNHIFDKTHFSACGEAEMGLAKSGVGSRTGAPAGRSTVPRFQSPPRRTQHADFPHCAPPFASRQRLWDLSCWGDFRPVASHSIGVKQPSSVVQPPPIPSFPAEALSFLSKSSEPSGRFSLRLDV